MVSFVNDIFKKKEIKHFSLKDSTEEFEQIFKEISMNKILSLEKLRKYSLFKTIFAALTAGAGFFTFAYLDTVRIPVKEEGPIMIISIVAIIIGALVYISAEKIRKKYTITYKKEVITKFLKLINNKLEYTYLENDEKNGKFLQRYKDAKLDENVYYDFNSDDYIEGFLTDDIFIEMADFNVTTTPKDKAVPIFEGVFAYIKCDITTNRIIKICRNEEKFFEGLRKIQMDNYLFENYFNVYTDDNIFAMRFLTHNIMEMLINFYEKYNIHFEIVLKNNELYIRFYSGKMFEPSIYRSSMDKQLLFSYYSIFKFIIDVTREINSIVKDI